MSKKTQAFFDTEMIEHGFVVIKSQPNSPNMNPIENLYVLLKMELHKRYLDTLTLHGPPHRIGQKLSERFIEVWWDIGEEVLGCLIDSVLSRVQVLIETDGWYTEF